MHSAFSLLNVWFTKITTHFFSFKATKAEGEQNMQHCTHLHSIFYPACLVECYTFTYIRKIKGDKLSK